MNNITKLLAFLMMAAIMLLIAGIYVRIAGTFPLHLETALFLSCGTIGLFTSLIGFAVSNDGS